MPGKQLLKITLSCIILLYDISNGILNQVLVQMVTYNLEEEEVL